MSSFDSTATSVTSATAVADDTESDAALLSGAKFVSADVLEEQRRLRQEEWERVRRPDQPLQRPDDSEPLKSLYEQLEENRLKKEEEFERKRQLQTARGLDDEDADFLDFVCQKQSELDEVREKENELLLLEIRNSIVKKYDSTSAAPKIALRLEHNPLATAAAAAAAIATATATATATAAAAATVTVTAITTSADGKATGSAGSSGSAGPPPGLGKRSRQADLLRSAVRKRSKSSDQSSVLNASQRSSDSTDPLNLNCSSASACDASAPAAPVATSKHGSLADVHVADATAMDQVGQRNVASIDCLKSLHGAGRAVAINSQPNVSLMPDSKPDPKPNPALRLMMSYADDDSSHSNSDSDQAEKEVDNQDKKENRKHHVQFDNQDNRTATQTSAQAFGLIPVGVYPSLIENSDHSDSDNSSIDSDSSVGDFCMPTMDRRCKIRQLIRKH